MLQQKIEGIPTSPADLVSGVVKIVSMPEVCIRVNDMVDDPHYSSADIGEVILRDAGITARLLRIVNSSFYGFPSRIETVSRAVTIVGVRDLRDLILATSAVDVFAKIPSELVDMASFWQHSIYTAVTSRILASRCHVLHTERLFVSGLIHDIGKLIMFNRLPEQMRDALYIAGDNLDAVADAEREVIGYTHAEVGAELASLWNLPPSIIEAVRCHHAPETARDFILEATLISLANTLSNGVTMGQNAEEQAARVEPFIWATLNIDDSMIGEVVEESQIQFEEACNILLPAQYNMS